jgi:hypothetical protein
MPACERSLTTTSLFRVCSGLANPAACWPQSRTATFSIFVTDELQIELPEIGAVV